MRERIRRRAAGVALALFLCWRRPPVRPSTTRRSGLRRRSGSARSPVVPGGFDDTVAISNLTNPTSVRFAADGTVFVAEKPAWSSASTISRTRRPQTVLDVRAATHDFWDRGLIGLAVDPRYPARPYVYVSYAYDQAPRWNDGCPTPPGATEDGCVIAGRIARVNVNERQPAVLLVEDFCQQFPSHSVGGLAFGADGALYASAGDGASFNYADERPTSGAPGNPCGDPAREGGSIRSQDLRTRGDPARARRRDPAAGSRHRRGRPATRSARAPMPTRAGSSGTGCATRSGSPSARARARSGSATSAGTGGRRSTAAPGGGVANFGWPCYEGAARMGTWDQLDNPVCEGLYGAGRAPTRRRTSPTTTARRSSPARPARRAPRRSPGWRSTTAGRSRPSTTARCSSPTTPAAACGRCCAGQRAARPGAAAPVRHRRAGRRPAGRPGRRPVLRRHRGGEVRRVRARERQPGARRRARPRRPDRGPLPLAVDVRRRAARPIPTARRSRYAWDFDANGTWDSTAAAADPHVHRLRHVPRAAARARPQRARVDRRGDGLRRHPADGGDRRARRRARRGRSATRSPSPAAARPGPARRCPPTELSWELDLHHCPRGGCHVHPIQTWTGAAREPRGARPRVPVVPRAAAHGDRRRPGHDGVAAARPAHGPR